jgi:hypothetical protein
VQDAGSVAGKWSSIRVRGLGVGALGEWIVLGPADGNRRGEFGRGTGCEVNHDSLLRQTFCSWTNKRGFTSGYTADEDESAGPLELVSRVVGRFEGIIPQGLKPKLNMRG